MTGECMEVDYMSCNNNGFFGGSNLWTIIILIFLLCWLGGNGCGNGCGGLTPCCNDCGC